MSIPTPPTIAPAPSPAPTRQDPANFRARADAYHTWLVPFVNTTLPAVIEWMRARAADVLAWSTAAQQSAAQVQSVAASAAVQNAAANAAAAQLAAQQAQVYATQAQATNPDSPIRLNPKRISAALTVPPGYNAASAGPISIDDGVTVTVSDHSTWSIH